MIEARSKSLEVTLVVAKKLSWKTFKLKAGKVGVDYRAKLGIVGGVAPLTWTVRAMGILLIGVAAWSVVELARYINNPAARTPVVAIREVGEP